MKADPADQRRLLDLAEIDAELARLAHRRRTLPEDGEHATAEKAVQAAKDKLIGIETTAGDLDRDIRRIERDVEGVRARTVRDHEMLAAAGVGAKQAADLQHELETLGRRQGVLEDEQLEIMEQREAVGIDLDHARGELATAEETLTDVAARRESALADITASEAGRRRARAAAVAAIGAADLLAAYETRLSQGRVGAGPLRERRCGACRLELDRTFIGQLRAAAADDVVHCEECGAILVRTSESGL
ncbi:zinc ribbon domain-containing protein [Pseudonocardia sp.]|uniref:zinc ribbon domain-containing protein n=1 Tax=Pseudonocardia sp. TaxID=60912 RepID=UPI003D13E94A